ncbi:TonB-dependent receptor [Sphingomonas sanxanigenens]|uniref:TonB-denpendent receptor n=1 Tax=Sphingomonas sanxanigenens DSM 19645 = NX02 TaxID=1123269 RepID=W0AHI0_9SPHN|nr:TonB-dependent receptor [Sphingomonas sanxanigenens]AHE55095.1 TonB-denpendent receptor [Sphingomonas sanxanigenens DSM 19645 = NX02]
MSHNKTRLAAHAAVIALAVGASSAHAQTAAADPAPEAAPLSDQGIQDIVVTARRQSESLQKTPISITALDSVALEKINVQSVEKVAQIAPNLVISQQSSSLSATSINIRGIGQTDPSLGLDTAVGIYLDGVYVARSAGSIFDLVDLERIEVLRGPQGTLFGRNTTGGAIQLVSRKPADAFGFLVKGGYGTRDNWYGRLRVDSGEWGDSGISVSGSYLHRQRDGYFDNALTPDSQDPGSLNVDAFAVGIRGDWGDFQLSYGFDFDDRTGAPGFFQTVALSADARTYYSRSPNYGGPALQFVGPDTRLFSGLQQPGGPGDTYISHTRSQGQNLTLSYDFSDALTLKSITGYRKLLLENVLGLSGQGDLQGLVLDFASPTLTSVGSVTPYNGFNSPQRQKQFSQEVQALGKVGDFNYVLGAYYFRERVSERNNQSLTLVLSPFALPFLGFPTAVQDALVAQGVDLIGLNLNPVAAYSQVSKSYAAFGQVSWKPQALDERFELTGGIRYTEDKKSIFLQNTSNGVSSVVGPPRGNVKYTNTSFLGSVSYQVTPTALVYAKVSTGYKSGGFNPRADTLNTFDPEKLTSYEAGTKLDLFDRHLRINAAFFYSKYDDLQVPQFAAGTGGASTLLVNAGSADFKGVELEVTAVPTRGLTLSGSLGYTDPNYKSFLFRNPNTNEITDVADTARFPNVAKFNSNVAVEYVFPPMDVGSLSARASYSYRSHVYFYPNDEVNPFQQDVDSPATNTVDARIALSDIPIGGRAKAEIAVLGENLLNEDQVLYGIDFGSLGFGGKFYSEPRRFFVEFKLSY